MLGLFASLFLAAPTSIDVYVDPRGDDARDGQTPETAVATPQAGIERAWGVIATSPAAEDLEVRLHIEGDIYLRETWRITAAPARSGKTVVHVGGWGTISGGTPLTSGEMGEFNGRAVWIAKLPDGVPADFHTLWAADARRPMGRAPAEGSYFEIESIPPTDQTKEWTQGQKAFVYRAAEAGIWEKIKPGAEVVTFSRWVDSHLTVASVDAAARIVRFTSPNVVQLSPGDLYYIENDPSLVDTQDSWWVDPRTRTLYMAGSESPGRLTVPRLSTILRIEGTRERQVTELHFSDLTFAHAYWWFGNEPTAEFGGNKVRGFVQAAAGAPGAIVADYMTRCDFRNCKISHVESYGMELRRGCRDNALTRCRVSDLGAGAVKIGETSIAAQAVDATRENVFQSCELTDGGHIHHQAVGMWIGQSPANRIQSCLISEFDYSGISAGWTWGYGPADAAGNVFEYNDVGNLGTRNASHVSPLGDMGGIYTLGNHTGTVIRNNVFHDIAGRSIAWGIYFDEGTSGAVAEGNVVVNTTHGGFHQHYGRENIVRGNIFAMGRDAQLWRTRNEEHISFHMTDNLILAGPGATLMQGDWSGHVELARNVYWRRGGKPFEFPGGRTLEQWQAAGNDSGSVFEDPGVHPEFLTHGYTLRADSPLRRHWQESAVKLFDGSYVIGPHSSR